MTQQLTQTKIVRSHQPAADVVLDYAPPLPGWTGRLLKHIPAFDSLRHYSWRAFGADLMAGLTVATVAVPQAMAYAILAGVPPHYGLYTAIVMTAVGAMLDSSRQLINGPTNAISIALLSALTVIAPEQRVQAAVLLALLVGLTQLGIALLRLGDLTRYVSHSVIVGFTLGASTLLVLDQIKNFFGLTPQGNPRDHFLVRFWLALTEGGPIHLPTMLIGASTIAIVVGVRRFNDFSRRRGARFPIPQHLVAVAFMAVLVWAFGLNDHGVKIVGPLPAALPSFELPQLEWDQIRLLAGNAFAIAVLGLLEAIAMAKAIAARTGQRLDINQQCLSEGAANFAGSFFQCFPGSGSLTRSAVNHQAGAVSQWSGVFSAVAVAGTVLLFAPLAQYIPQSALAGLLMLAAFRMVEGKQLRFHLRATKFDAGIVLATALAAVAISVEFCIVIGVFISFMLYVPRAAHVRMVQYTLTPEQRIRERLPGDAHCERLLCYGLEGDLFFGAEPELHKHFSAIEKQTAQSKFRVVILVLKGARNPDASFLQLLRTFHANLEKGDVELLLCAVQPDLAKALSITALDEGFGNNRIFHDGPIAGVSTHDAVLRAYELLGDDFCSSCPRKQPRIGHDEPLVYEI